MSIAARIWITDTHCNVFVAGFFQDMVQRFINDCLIYKAPDAAQDCSGIRLSHCADIKIHHNYFVPHTARGLFEGVRTENGTHRCQISDNTFSLADRVLHFDDTTTGCTPGTISCSTRKGKASTAAAKTASGTWAKTIGQTHPQAEPNARWREAPLALVGPTLAA